MRTIQLEVADDQLFSKSAALLTAATELAYYTVLCSALNAEEVTKNFNPKRLFRTTFALMYCLVTDMPFFRKKGIVFEL